MAMHADQLKISVDVVRRLVRAQFPQWAAMPVRPVDSTGTVNAIFRIGDTYAARFPLRWTEPTEALTWLESEHRAILEFEACSPVAIPVPLAIGAPGHGYRLPWAVHTWLPGDTALAQDPARSTEFAHDLAALLLALRSADTKGRRFSGTGRGGNLADPRPMDGDLLPQQ